MSKSLGNTIEPQDLLKTDGADVIRLWVASLDYTNDDPLSKEILQRTAEAYRKIRNTARFLLSNLFDFDPAKDAVPGRASSSRSSAGSSTPPRASRPRRATPTRATSSTPSRAGSSTSSRRTSRRSGATSARTRSTSSRRTIPCGARPRRRRGSSSRRSRSRCPRSARSRPRRSSSRCRGTREDPSRAVPEELGATCRFRRFLRMKERRGERSSRSGRSSCSPSSRCDARARSAPRRRRWPSSGAAAGLDEALALLPFQKKNSRTCFGTAVRRAGGRRRRRLSPAPPRARSARAAGRSGRTSSPAKTASARAAARVVGELESPGDAAPPLPRPLPRRRGSRPGSRRRSSSRRIPLHDTIPVIRGFFDLTHLQNTGAAFGIFASVGLGRAPLLVTLARRRRLRAASSRGP